MSVFHFHGVDGGEHPDRDGRELPSADEARKEALRAAGAMLQEAASGRNDFDQSWEMRVTDAHGLVLFLLDFNMAKSPAVTGSSTNAE